MRHLSDVVYLTHQYQQEKHRRFEKNEESGKKHWWYEFFFGEYPSMPYNVRFTWTWQKIAMTSVLWSENWCAIKWKCPDLKPFPFFSAKWVVTINYMFHLNSSLLNHLPTVIRGEILSSCHLSEGCCRAVSLRMVYRKIIFLSSRAEERGTNGCNQTTTSPKLNSNNCPKLQVRLFT